MFSSGEARASASQAGSQSTPVLGQGLARESPEIPGWRGIRKGGDWGVSQGKCGGSEGPSNTAEAPEPAARPAGVGGAGGQGRAVTEALHSVLGPPRASTSPSS